MWEDRSGIKKVSLNVSPKTGTSDGVLETWTVGWVSEQIGQPQDETQEGGLCAQSREAHGGRVQGVDLGEWDGVGMPCRGQAARAE